MAHVKILDLCRLCATCSFGEQRAPVFEYENNSERKYVQSLINKHLGIKIAEHKSLPNKICPECIQGLRSFGKLFRRCHEVQEMFASLADGYRLSIKFAKFKQKSSTVDTREDLSAAKTIPNTDNSLVTENTNNDKGSPNELEGSTLQVIPYQLQVVEWKKVAMVKNALPSNLLNTSKAEKTLDVKAKKTIPKSKVCKESQPLVITVSDDNDENCGSHLNNASPRIDKKKVQESEVGPENKNENKKSEDLPLPNVKRSRYNDIVFGSYHSLNRHCRVKHRSTPRMKCICGREIRSLPAVKNHYRLHIGSNDCHKCNEKFNDEESRCLHVLSHAQNRTKDFICSKCGLLVHSYMSLYSHEKVHLPYEERFPVVCDICQKRFKAKSVVEEHIITQHLNEKSYICEQCDKILSTKNTLTAHLKTHSLDKPWTCEVCGARFTAKSSLQVHMDKHTGRRYECPHCPKDLASRHSLSQHLTMHEEQSTKISLACEVCSKVFHSTLGLKRHLKRHANANVHTLKKALQNSNNEI